MSKSCDTHTAHRSDGGTQQLHFIHSSQAGALQNWRTLVCARADITSW